MFFRIYQIACYLTVSVFTGLVSASIYEFCADNQIFSFSYDACPGGILLKEPMELTEPCHCVNKHLTVYSACDSSSPSLHYPTKACPRYEGTNKDSVLIQLVQPFGKPYNNSAKLSKINKDSKCRRARSACTRDNLNTIATSLSIFKSLNNEIQSEFLNNIVSNTENREKLIARASSSHRQKRDLSLITNTKLRERIIDTINFLNELQFGDDDGSIKKQNSMTFQMLARTVKIYNFITPNSIVEDGTVNSLLEYFFKKYEELEAPSATGRFAIDDHVDKTIFDDVMSRLHECSSKASEVSQEFEFVSKPGMCPADVTHVIDKVVRPDGSVKRRHLELGKLMPENRKYVPETEDLILGALWKIFDSVYSYCFPYVFSYHNAQALFYYLTFMENIFLFGKVQDDYISKDGHGTSAYNSRIEHENLVALMKNIDFMDEAVHMLGQYKQFFLKPASPEESETKDNASTRKKRSRSLESYISWSDLEIWGGRAYCLQTRNPSLPPSIANAYPSVQNLCA